MRQSSDLQLLAPGNDKGQRANAGLSPISSVVTDAEPCNGFFA